MLRYCKDLLKEAKVHLKDCPDTCLASEAAYTHAVHPSTMKQYTKLPLKWPTTVTQRNIHRIHTLSKNKNVVDADTVDMCTRLSKSNAQPGVTGVQSATNGITWRMCVAVPMQIEADKATQLSAARRLIK